MDDQYDLLSDISLSDDYVTVSKDNVNVILYSQKIDNASTVTASVDFSKEYISANYTITTNTSENGSISSSVGIRYSPDPKKSNNSNNKSKNRNDNFDFSFSSIPAKDWSKSTSQDALLAIEGLATVLLMGVLCFA